MIVPSVTLSPICGRVTDTDIYAASYAVWSARPAIDSAASPNTSDSDG
jgi:hypothetical protein